MCLLVMQEQNTTIEDENLRNAYDSNPDGVGYSFINSENRIMTKKYRDYKKFLLAYQGDIKEFGSSSPFLLHFRMPTHGQSEGTFNVHPFKVSKDTVFAHNGIISDVDDDKKLSDTQVFNRDILKKLKDEFLVDVILVKLIEGFIGTSKLAFLNRDGSFKILNEELGDWDKGIWYSNNSYKSRTERYTRYTTAENKWWKSYTAYGVEADEDGYEDVFTNVTTKQATIPHKNAMKPSLECSYCSDMVCSLTHYDVSELYAEKEPSFMWMCDDCVELEEGYQKVEKEYYSEKRLKDINSKEVAIVEIIGRT